MNRNKILNVIAVLFIAVVAGVTSLITANPNNLQLIGSYAKTKAKDTTSAFENYIDSKIRKAEKASRGACDGFSCVVTDYTQTAAGQSSGASVSDCTSYYTGLGVPSDQAQSKCSSEVKPQGFSGNNNASVSTDSKCNNQCASNETCVSIGSGYYGCQVTSTITTQTGEKRCNGNNLETFNGSSWSSTFCPNGCSGGSCNAGNATAIGSVVKNCSGGSLVTSQDGRVITQVNCQYGCSNSSCNSAPESVAGAPAATPFVTPVTSNYTNPNLPQNQTSQPGTTGTVPTNTSITPSQISSADTCTSHGWYWDSTKRTCTTTPTTSVSITPSGSVSLKTSIGGICNFNSDCDSGYCGTDRCQTPPQPVAQPPAQQGSIGTATSGNNTNLAGLIAFYATNQLGIDTTGITQSLNNLTAVQNQIKSQNPNASALSLAMNPSNLIASIEVAKQTTQQITPLFTTGGINNPVNKTIASVVANFPVVGFNTMATSAQILIQGEVMAGTNRSLQNNTLLVTGVNLLGLTPVVESSNRTFGYGMTAEQKQQYYSSGNFLNRLGDAVNVGAFAVLTADQLGGAFAPTIREAAGKQVQQAITQPIANNINEALSVLRLGGNTGAIPITPSVSGDVEALASAKQTAGELTAGSNITAGSTTKSVSTVDNAVAAAPQVSENLVSGQNIGPSNQVLSPAQRFNNILRGVPETTSAEDSSLLNKIYSPQNPAPTSLVGTGTQPLSGSDMLIPGNQTTTAQENIALLGQKSTQPATAAEILGNTEVSQASAELVDASAHNPNLIVSANQTDPLFGVGDTGTQNAIADAQSLGNELASAKTAAAPTEIVAQAPTVKAPATQTALKPWEATPEQSAAENAVKQKLMNAQTLNAQDQQVLEQNQIRFQALVEASPQDAATMTNGDFQNWLNPKLGAVRNGDLQAASDAFEADRLRGDKFGMSAVANEVADLATVDIAKIEDPVARAAAEAKVSQASQLLGQMDTEIAQANAAIPTNIEGPYVKIPESNNPITTALDVAPGSQSPTFDNLVNSYETGGKSTEAAYNNALSDSEQMRNWLGANTNNGDVIAARNGEFYVKRGAYWEQINSDGTLNNQVKIVESDQGNIALSGGQIVAQGSKVNFAPLSASAKEQLVQNLIDKASNDGISPEVFFSSLISDGYPPDEITVKLYDDAMAAVNQRYGNTNFFTQARTALDEAINGSRTLETGAAQAENSAAAAAAPTNELAPAPAAAPETASAQTSKPGILDTLFGKKTIKISPQSTGEITLHPGDIVSWNGHTNTIPDPSVVKTDIYWQVVNGDGLPQKLTPAGITVDISKNPVIEFGSLDPSGRTIDDTVAGITESLGNTRGTPAQIVISGSIAEPTVVTQQGVLASWQNTKNLIVGGFNDLVGRGTETGGAVNVAEKAQAVEQANPSVVQNVRNYFKGVQSGFDNDVVKPLGDALFGKSASETPVALKPWEASPEQLTAENAVNQKIMSGQTLNAEDQQILEQAKARLQTLVNATPDEAATMSNTDFQKWSNSKLGNIANGDVQSANDVYQAAKLRGDEIVIQRIKGDVSNIAVADTEKITDPIQKANAEASQQQARDLLGKIDAEQSAAPASETSKVQAIFQRVKNFLTNQQPAEAGGGITIRSGQLPPPEPGTYHPTSANPVIAKMEVSVDSGGNAFIKTNLNSSPVGDVYVPLRDGEGIPGVPTGNVIKSGNNYFYLSGYGEGENVTLLTGSEKAPNLIQKAVNTLTDNAAANAAKKSLLSTNKDWILDSDVAKELLDSGYRPENINENVINDFQSSYYKAFRAKNPISIASSVESPTIGKFFGSVGNTVAKNPGKIALGIFAGTQIAVQRDEIYNAYETLVNPGYYSPTLGVRVYYKNGGWYRADNGEKISDGTSFAYQNSTYIERSGGPAAIGSFLGQYININESTFQSAEWQNLQNKVQAQTSNDPNNITAITHAIHDNTVYNPYVASEYYTTNALGQQVDTPFYQKVGLSMLDVYFGGYSDHNLSNILGKNQGVCLDFALAEQSYLAKLGIRSELATGFVGGAGLGNGHAFLYLVDSNGNKYIADPTSGFTYKYDDYIKTMNITDFQIVPDIIKFSNPDQTQPFTVDGQSSTESVNQTATQVPPIQINSPPVTDITTPLKDQTDKIQTVKYGTAVTNPQFYSPTTTDPYKDIPSWFYTKVLQNVDATCTSKSECLAKYNSLPLADGNGNLKLDLNPNYVPSDLVNMTDYGIPVGTSNDQITKESAPLVKKLINDLNNEGRGVIVAYGYRSYRDQGNIRNDVGSGAGLPGQSTHQAGQTLDIDYTRANGTINPNQPLNNNDRITQILHQDGFVRPFPINDPGHVIALDAIQPGIVQALIDAGINPDNDEVVKQVLLGLAQTYEFQMQSNTISN